jgi:hypothetical protein
MKRAFISSTVKDLSAYREVARRAVSQVGWQPVLVNEDDLIATGKSLEQCMIRVCQCDLLILVAGYRYGYVPTPSQGGDGEKSVVRWELFAWRELLKEQGGYDPLVFIAQHPTLRCGEQEDRDASERQIKFRAALERNYYKHDFEFVPDAGPAQQLTLQKFEAALKTQLAECKNEMLEDEQAELEKRTERAERRARKARAAQQRADEKAAWALGTAGAAIGFAAWLAAKK